MLMHTLGEKDRVKRMPAVPFRHDSKEAYRIARAPVRCSILCLAPGSRFERADCSSSVIREQLSEKGEKLLNAPALSLSLLNRARVIHISSRLVTVANQRRFYRVFFTLRVSSADRMSVAVICHHPRAGITRLRRLRSTAR